MGRNQPKANNQSIPMTKIRFEIVIKIVVADLKNRDILSNSKVQG